MKLGCKKDLDPSIAHIWGDLVFGRSRLLKNGSLMLGKSRMWKNRRRSDRRPQNTRRVEIPRSAHLGASLGFNTFVGFPRISSQNWPVIPPLNIAIILWWRLGHTVIVIKDGSHFRAQSRMQLFIQSCTGVNKIFLPYQLTWHLLLV